jgi:hypothetical protein
MLNARFRDRAKASYDRWREQKRFRIWGAVGAAVLALFLVAGIVLLKYDGSSKLAAKRGEPATVGQGPLVTDPLAPANIAAPSGRD